MRVQMSWSALAAAGMTLGTAVLYVSILAAEGEGDLREALPLAVVALLIVAGGAAAVGAVIGDAHVRAPVLGAAGALLLGLGMLAGWSIGGLLVIAGLLAGLPAARAAAALGTRAAALTVPLLLAGAFAVFWIRQLLV